MVSVWRSDSPVEFARDVWVLLDGVVMLTLLGGKQEVECGLEHICFEQGWGVLVPSPRTTASELHVLGC